MKKTLIALLALGSVAFGAAVKVNENGTLSSTGTNYVYTWTEGNWKYLKSSQTAGDLQGPTSNFYPNGANDGAILGYSYDPVSGEFTSGAISTSAAPIGNIGSSEVYIGGEVSLSSGDLRSDVKTIHFAKDSTITVAADIGLKNAVTFDFGDITSSTAAFMNTSHAVWTEASTAITLSGTYTYTPEMEPRVVFMANNFNYGGTVSKDVFRNGFIVKDSNGNELENIGVITNIDELKEGQSAILWQNNHATLVANASVPEPTTGSLSLLALAGLCARRRKK